jgi:hypothetical protein
MIRKLIEEEKVGEREGGLGFVEVLMDSTLLEDLPIRYRVSFLLWFFLWGTKAGGITRWLMCEG